jgi:RNA polymerase sigma-70 factor (ECF subfamily)
MASWEPRIVPAGEPSEEEPQLIDKSRRGDAGAFAELVGLHQGRVRAYIAGSISRPDVVDDLAQEVFLAAYRSLDKYRPDAPLGIWLLGIARHKALNHLRQELRRLSRETRSLEAALAPLKLEALEADDRELPLRDRELAALQRCLEGLPPDGATMIADRYFRARSISDIARALGKREGAIRMTLLRLRQGLRSCVETRMSREGS